MKKLSKALFSLCGFFITATGVGRAYAASCSINDNIYSKPDGGITVRAVNVTYNCGGMGEMVVGGVYPDVNQTAYNGYVAIWGCDNCNDGYTLTYNYVRISSMFTCDIPVPYCYRNYSGGGSTTPSVPDTTVSWYKESFTCVAASDCWGKTSGTYLYDNGKMTSYSKCENGYCYSKRIGGSNQYLYHCAPGYYKDAGVDCSVSNKWINCCLRCPPYEDDLNSIDSTYVDATGYTQSDIGYCMLDSYHSVVDETGSWIFSQNCKYSS